MRNGHGIKDRLHSRRYKLTDDDRGSRSRSSREHFKAFSWCSSNVVAIPHAGGTAIPAACAKLAPAIFTIHAAANGWGPGKIAFYRLIAFNTVVVVILVPVVASRINGSSRGSRSSSTGNRMRNTVVVVIVVPVVVSRINGNSRNSRGSSTSNSMRNRTSIVIEA